MHQTVMNRRKDLKSRLQRREKVFAGWTSLGHPQVTEIFGRAGFDFVGIDIEHSTISQAESQRIIAAAQANGMVCLPRIASHNREMARRLLDSGADGLIVPVVETAEDVRAIIDWMKYPPAGKRGFGVARAQGYGFDFKEYTSTWNESSILIVQIESIQAVKNVDEILAFPEVDGVMVGPYDISGSLNVPGQISHPSVVEAGLAVVEACRKAGKSCGNQIVEPDEAAIREFFGRDYTFAVLASDIFALWKWSERMRSLMGRAGA
jgi:2-dehydro-3-deoxyglucarate aldolase